MNPPPDASTLDVKDNDAEDLELQRTMIYDAEFWMQNYARIRKKSGKVESVEKVNRLQEKVLAYYRQCRLLKKPCLIMILKPRQKGASTIAQGIIYHHLRRNPELNGLIMGDVTSTSEKVFDMFRRYAELDDFPWRDKLGKLTPDSNLSEKITLPNGSTYSNETAGSSNAGRSGTIQVFHGDEVGFWTKAQGKDPWNAVLNSFADTYPTSLGFVTSTANGASGSFYNTWNGKNAWHKIFAAWYEFDDSVIEFSSNEEREEFKRSMTPDEEQEQALYDVTLEQLNWRRHTIETKCEGDIGRFRQEFPSDPETCFNLSGGAKFDLTSIKQSEAEAKTNDKRQRCNLLIQGDSFRTVAKLHDPKGEVFIQEEPMVGCRYIGALDTMTGEDQSTGATAQRDWHAAQIWRAPYMTRGGEWQRAALVALHRSQVDTDVLAEIFASMAIYYGRCMTIPEINGEAGVHIVKELKKYKIPMFRRRALSASSRHKMTDEEVLGAFGWRTDAQTKRLIITNMVPLVRKCELDIRFPEVWSEFRTFIQTAGGTCEALSGKFDDQVIAAGIANYNIGSATEYRERPGFFGEERDGWRVG